MPVTGITTTTHAYRYGSQRYGFTVYGGLAPASIVPSRNTSGILFFTSNDRYQVVACSYAGSLDVAPEFRYWYSAAPTWAEELNSDAFLPPYYSADEDGTVTTGSLELPFRRVKAPQEMLVAGVVVEFICRPSSITSETLSAQTNCTFSVHVEAQGVANYGATVADGSTGMIVTDTIAFSETVEDQSSLVWPNIRTQVFPTRTIRCKAARAVITNISLVEILSVYLVGKTSIPDRNA